MHRSPLGAWFLRVGRWLHIRCGLPRRSIFHIFQQFFMKNLNSHVSWIMQFHGIFRLWNLIPSMRSCGTIQFFLLLCEYLYELRIRIVSGISPVRITGNMSHLPFWPFKYKTQRQPRLNMHIVACNRTNERRWKLWLSSAHDNKVTWIRCWVYFFYCELILRPYHTSVQYQNPRVNIDTQNFDISCTCEKALSLRWLLLDNDGLEPITL